MGILIATGVEDNARWDEVVAVQKQAAAGEARKSLFGPDYRNPNSFCTSLSKVKSATSLTGTSRVTLTSRLA